MKTVIGFQGEGFINRQHCAQRRLFKLLRGQFWGFSSCSGDTLHRWGWNMARRWGPKVSSMPNFTPIGATIRVQDSQNWNFWDLVKMWNINAPQNLQTLYIVPGCVSCQNFVAFPQGVMELWVF